jgi:hypothetical protein
MNNPLNFRKPIAVIAALLCIAGSANAEYAYLRATAAATNTTSSDSGSFPTTSQFAFVPELNLRIGMSGGRFELYNYGTVSTQIAHYSRANLCRSSGGVINLAANHRRLDAYRSLAGIYGVSPLFCLYSGSSYVNAEVVLQFKNGQILPSDIATAPDTNGGGARSLHVVDSDADGKSVSAAGAGLFKVTASVTSLKTATITLTNPGAQMVRLAWKSLDDTADPGVLVKIWCRNLPGNVVMYDMKGRPTNALSTVIFPRVAKTYSGECPAGETAVKAEFEGVWKFM